jgi:hypothetical protein
MAFGDDFAAALGGSPGVSVDPALFDPPEATAQQLSDFKSFIDGLDQASLASLDAVTGSGVDRSQATDEDGALSLPGGAFFAVAAAAQQPVEQVASAAQQNRDSVQGTA